MARSQRRHDAGRPGLAFGIAGDLSRPRGGRPNAEVRQDRASGTVAAHPVNAAAGRRRRRAQVEPRALQCGTDSSRDRGERAFGAACPRPRRCPRRGSWRCASPSGGRCRGAREDEVLKARGEPFDLILDARGHSTSSRWGRGSTPTGSAGPSARACHPTTPPGRRCSRALGVTAERDVGFGLGDFGEGPAQVHRRRRDRARARPTALAPTAPSPP